MQTEPNIEPTTNNQQPTTNNQQPTTNNQQPHVTGLTTTSETHICDGKDVSCMLALPYFFPERATDPTFIGIVLRNCMGEGILGLPPHHNNRPVVEYHFKVLVLFI